MNRAKYRAISGGRALFAAVLLAYAASACAQDAKGEKPIQDNSFLLEEAYNQEYGVVQHINAFRRGWTSKEWEYTFIQEWPVDTAPRHQLSYTMPALRPDLSSGAGVGDIALNYRYQVIGSGDTRVAFAPRLSLLLASGEPRFGRGAGGAGVQVNLPLSVVAHKRLVTHWNLGATVVPHARNGAGEKAATYGYNLGQSFIWLAHPRFNVMLETVFLSAEEVVAPGKTQRANALLLNPGVRWAWNFSNGLQIVPGIGVPLGMGPSAGERSVLFYLSFEHPYRKARR